MGGMDGFGAVAREEQEPVFHFDWEARSFALLLASRGWEARSVAASRPPGSADALRHAIERIPAARYLNSSYYERWLDAAQILLFENGIVSREELAQRGTDPPLPSQPLIHLAGPAKKASRIRAARFAPGDPVVARNINYMGHTRLPRYVRGKQGVIQRDWGAYPLPDSIVHGGGERSQHVYSVVFAARELWGPNASARDKVHIDLWDDYLESPTPPAKRAAKRRAIKLRRRKR
jgi:nitrile hydratase subunit beta